MPQTHEELEREALAEYRAMMRGFKATSGPVWMEIDLTLPQLRTLLILAEEGPLIIGQIGGRFPSWFGRSLPAEKQEDVVLHRRLLSIRLLQEAGCSFSLRYAQGSIHDGPHYSFSKEGIRSTDGPDGSVVSEPSDELAAVGKERGFSVWRAGDARALLSSRDGSDRKAHPLPCCCGHGARIGIGLFLWMFTQGKQSFPF